MATQRRNNKFITTILIKADHYSLAKTIFLAKVNILIYFTRSRSD